MTRPDLARRFREIVARGIERAEREEREHLAKLRYRPVAPLRRPRGRAARKGRGSDRIGAGE